ncbi:MAG: hypothetical protein AAB710_01215 [Patescibacteria group bacterium]
MVTITKENKTIRQARQDIARVLDQYQVTLPEVMGITKKRDVDEDIWNAMKGNYEQIQEQLFAKNYPALWKKAQKRK